MFNYIFFPAEQELNGSICKTTPLRCQTSCNWTHNTSLAQFRESLNIFKCCRTGIKLVKSRSCDMRLRQIQILHYSCMIWSSNKVTVGIPCITNNTSSASALSSATSVCTRLFLHHASMWTFKCQREREKRQFKFKEMKFSLLHQVRLNQVDYQKETLFFFFYHPPLAQWRSNCTLTWSAFKFSYCPALLLVTPLLVGGLTDSRTLLHVYWELLGIKIKLKKHHRPSYFSRVLRLVLMFGMWF